MAAVLDLADEFAELIRKQSKGTLVDWLARAEASPIPEMRHFSEGIRRDEIDPALDLTIAPIDCHRGSYGGFILTKPTCKRAHPSQSTTFGPREPFGQAVRSLTSDERGEPISELDRFADRAVARAQSVQVPPILLRPVLGSDYGCDRQPSGRRNIGLRLSGGEPVWTRGHSHFCFESPDVVCDSHLAGATPHHHEFVAEPAPASFRKPTADVFVEPIQ